MANAQENSKRQTLKSLILYIIIGFFAIGIIISSLPKELDALSVVILLAYIIVGIVKIFLYIKSIVRNKKEKVNDLITPNNSEAEKATAVSSQAEEKKPKSVVQYHPNTINIIRALDFLQAPTDYVAFDLETTGLHPESNEIIEIGAVKVQNGQIVSSFQQLVKPSNPVPPQASKVNHITNTLLKDSPTIVEVLPRFLEFIKDVPVLIAHNANFDAGFLCAAADHNALTINHSYVDSLEIAKEAWPDLPNKKLGTVADHIGVVNQQAHRALGDAEVVHEIVKAALQGIPEKKQEEEVRSLQNRLEEEISALDNKLEGYRFCITGEFPGASRSDIEKLIMLHGGKTTTSVSGKTDFLVVGEYDESYGPNYISGKQKKALEMIELGKKIKIISSGDLEKLIQGASLT